MKFEPKDTKRTKSRMGKATVGQVRDLMNSVDYNVGGSKSNRLQGFDNEHSSYPKNLKEFQDAPTIGTKNIYAHMWKKIEGLVTTNISSEKEFMDNMRVGFAEAPPFAQQKLMELNFIYVILIKLTADKRHQMLTDMLGMAEKFGDKHGPFGKLY